MITLGAADPESWRRLLESQTWGKRADVDALRRRFRKLELQRPDLGVFAGPRRRVEPGYRSVTYKEAFSPGLVRTILDGWCDLDGPLLDPFAGMGTSLLVAAERGLPSFGIEMLPYPSWATGVLIRAHEADPHQLREIAEVAAAKALRSRRTRPEHALAAPAASWALPPDVHRVLSSIQRALPERGSGVDADFLHLALLSVVEGVSRSVKDGTSLRHRARQREGRPPRPGRKDQMVGVRDVTEAFTAAVEGLCEDLPKMPNATQAAVVGGDARRMPLMDGTVGAAIFSPPYPNRYDYSAIYQLELAFGRFVTSGLELRSLRKRLLRSHLEAPPPGHLVLDDPAVLGILRSTAEAAEGGPDERGRTLRMLVGYFDDMQQVLGELVRVLRPGAPAACVIGTQTYFGHPIPTDLMLASIAEGVGLVVDGCWVLRHKRVAVQQRARGAAEGGGRESVVVLRRP